jgi:hypothetical protein
MLGGTREQQMAKAVRRKSAMQIGVIGSWEENLDKEIYDLAEEVGKLVAKRRFLFGSPKNPTATFC